jgi:hypothetical protein
MNGVEIGLLICAVLFTSIGMFLVTTQHKWVWRNFYTAIPVICIFLAWKIVPAGWNSFNRWLTILALASAFVLADIVWFVVVTVVLWRSITTDGKSF